MNVEATSNSSQGNVIDSISAMTAIRGICQPENHMLVV
jgi:hypothetical protein